MRKIHVSQYVASNPCAHCSCPAHCCYLCVERELFAAPLLSPRNDDGRARRRRALLNPPHAPRHSFAARGDCTMLSGASRARSAPAILKGSGVVVGGILAWRGAARRRCCGSAGALVRARPRRYRATGRGRWRRRRRRLLAALAAGGVLASAVCTPHIAPRRCAPKPRCSARALAPRAARTATAPPRRRLLVRCRRRQLDLRKSRACSTHQPCCFKCTHSKPQQSPPATLSL